MVSSVTNDRCYQYFCLSTDTKPITGVGNGSVAYEIDTQNVYIFDQANQVWVKQ